MLMNTSLPHGRSASSNAWVGLCSSPAPSSPCSLAAYAESLLSRLQPYSHSHLSKALSSPRLLSSLEADVSAVGKEKRGVLCGAQEDGAASRRAIDRKRPVRLAIPESARLASLQKAKLFILPEQQSSYIQEDELFAVAAKRGLKDYMEDSYTACTHFQGNSKQAFFGVFDGHGGKQAAQFVSANLSKHVSAALQNQKSGNTSLEDAMRTAYRTADAELLDQHASSGACAVSVLIKEGEMVVSNAGDCKAVLCRAGQAECLSTLHRGNNEAERQRVEELGGFVDCYNGTWRLQGSLAVTRGFGDACLKQWVSAEPETKQRHITRDCEFLILASDGLWDQLSEQETVDCARKVFLELGTDKWADLSAASISSNPQVCASSSVRNKQSELEVSSSMMNACEELVQAACRRGNRDDITVMIVPLNSFAIVEP